MATLDDSPSLFSGQQWTDWAGSVLSDLESEINDSDDPDDDTGSDSMKLRKEDMPLFGLCPSRDEFYLVVCEKCNQVLKPQAFQTHLDIRHGGKGSYTIASSTTKTTSQSSSGKHSVSPSKSHSKSHASSSRSHSKSHKSHGSSSRSSSHASSHIPKHIPPPVVKPAPARSLSPLLGGSGAQPPPHEDISPVSVSIEEEITHSLATKASVKEPPPSLDTASKVGAQSPHTDKVKDSKLKKNHSLPVVKVERMPDTPAMKKQRESTGSARTSLTNGSIRRSRSPPLSMPVLTEDIDIKPSLSLPPDLFEPSSPMLADEEELPPVPDAEIDTAVSAILEPVSPVLEAETSSFISLATSASTLTTNTVTMATMTLSSTSVTNVTNTTSSFTFSSMGRPHFPTGSIRVNFSSTGVLSTITGSGAAGVNINNNNVTKASSAASDNTSKPSLYSSNGNIENISDIVKSTINANSSGGFKSLSPLLTSPVKSTSGSSHSSMNISLKSPPSLSNVTKSPSAATINSKLGSKLSPGGSGVFKSLSAGSLSSSGGSSSSSSSSRVAAVNSEALKNLQLINKPDKIIPLKDREYDANKHCGVIVAETGKPCTRSLTCKSHALSLRRNVQGRRLPFDELLQEHKEAKEAYMKAKAQSKEASAALKAANSANTPGKGAHSTTPGLPPFKSHSMTSISATSPSPKMNAHLNQNVGSVGKEGVAGAGVGASKSITMNVFPPQVKQPVTPQKPGTPATFRSSLGSLQLGSPPATPGAREEAFSPLGKVEKLSDEGEDAMAAAVPGGKDDSYTSYHPRPIAACSFGARHHNLHGNSIGCHSFGRKTDQLRAAFLDLLEKHLHPSPPKKLCVESNLAKENETLQISSDPYDFGYLNPTKNVLGQHILQAPVSVMNTAVLNKVIAKPKSKTHATTNISSATKPKFKDTVSGCKSPGVMANLQPGLLSSAKKRRISGAAGSQATINLQGTSLGGATLVSAPSIIASVGALTNSVSGSPQFAIAIPNMNLSGTTLSQISANLVASGNLKPGKNNVIKDMGFVVTGIPQEAILNGQYVNITSAQLAGEVGAGGQVQQVTVEDGGKITAQPAPHPAPHPHPQPAAQVITNNKTPPQPKFINNMDTLQRAIQAGKITGLPGNTLLMEGAVLQPVSLTTASTNPGVSMGNVVFSQTQHNAAATAPSPHVRSGSDRPQVSTSPLPNGVVTTPADKELIIRQQVFQPKSLPPQTAFVQQHPHPHPQHHRVASGAGLPQQQQPTVGSTQPAHHQLLTGGAQLHHHQGGGFTFQSPPHAAGAAAAPHPGAAQPQPVSSAVPSQQISVNTSRVLTSQQLSQLQMKNSSLHHKPHPAAGSLNKLTMQPVSITLPFVAQSSMGVGGNQTALFITNEEAQKQGIHLHHSTEQPAQPAPQLAAPSQTTDHSTIMS